MTFLQPACVAGHAPETMVNAVATELARISTVEARLFSSVATEPTISWDIVVVIAAPVVVLVLGRLVSLNLLVAVEGVCAWRCRMALVVRLSIRAMAAFAIQVID